MDSQHIKLIFHRFSSLALKIAPSILNIYPEICATDNDAVQRICHLCKKSCPVLMQNSVYTSRAIGKVARESKQQ